MLMTSSFLFYLQFEDPYLYPTKHWRYCEFLKQDVTSSSPGQQIYLQSYLNLLNMRQVTTSKGANLKFSFNLQAVRDEDVQIKVIMTALGHEIE